MISHYCKVTVLNDSHNLEAVVLINILESESHSTRRFLRIMKPWYYIFSHNRESIVLDKFLRIVKL